jgi:hypothetical protein
MLSASIGQDCQTSHFYPPRKHRRKNSALHTGNIAQFREDLFPRKKSLEGAREDLCPQMTQIHADHQFRVLFFPICVHLRDLRAIPDSVSAGRAVFSGGTSFFFTAGRAAPWSSISLYCGQPVPSLFQGFLSEKWSQKHLSDSIFLTSLLRLLRHLPAQVALLRASSLRPARSTIPCRCPAHLIIGGKGGSGVLLSVASAASCSILVFSLVAAGRAAPSGLRDFALKAPSKCVRSAKPLSVADPPFIIYHFALIISHIGS